MRLALLAALLAAAPALAASRTSFHVGARVVQSATVSARVGPSAIVLGTRTRAAGMVQVGSAAPVPAADGLKIAPPRSGDVVVTLLY